MTGLSGRRSRAGRPARGQAFVEYVVVVTFGILVLVTNDQVIWGLRDAIRNNYDGYSYAVSLSEYPDADNGVGYRNMLEAQGAPDEMVDYLADDPLDMVEFLINEYLLSSLPGLGEFDFGALPLNPAEFLSPF